MPDLTLDEIKAEVRAMDPKLEDDDFFKTAVLLLSAAFYGANINQMVEFTDLPLEFVAPRFERLIDSGVFQADGMVCAEWLDDEIGGISFWLDVLAAEGMVERKPTD